MDDSMLVASEEATPGSVIAKHERISPSSRGTSHLRRCSSVPYLASVSMLPVSGAEQLKTSLAQAQAPITRLRCEYSRLVSPAPRRSPPRLRGGRRSSSAVSEGIQRFHSPAALASALSCSISGCTVHLSGPRLCSQRAPSAGRTLSAMKRSSRSSSAAARALGPKPAAEQAPPAGGSWRGTASAPASLWRAQRASCSSVPALASLRASGDEALPAMALARTPAAMADMRNRESAT
mmetsp:Transcript_9871/g.23570  ORF Transcript_9871/g.23570 Transcript_9871/m.23570 type:complete len:236 (-) Transcript_9871:466-1173(-)